MRPHNRISQFDDGSVGSTAAAAAGIAGSGNGSLGGGASAGQAAPPRPGIIQVVWSRRWWVLLTTLACFAGSFVYLSRQVPIYASSSRLYIQQNIKPFSGIGAAATDPINVQSGLATQCELIKSTPLLSQAAAMPEVQQLDMMRGADNPVNVIKSGLSVEIGRTNDIVTISFESSYREEAAGVVNAVVDAYVTYMSRQRSNTAAEVLRQLQRENEKLSVEFKEKLQKTLDFKRTHGVLSFSDEKGNIITQRLARLSDSLTNAQFEEMDAEANYKSVEALKGDARRLLEMARQAAAAAGKLTLAPPDLDRDGAGVTVVNGGPTADERLDQVLEPLQARIDDAEFQLTQLKRRLAPEHDAIVDAEADLELLKQRLADRKERVEQIKAQNAQRETRQAEDHARLARLHGDDRDRELVDNFVNGAAQRVAVAKQRLAQLQAAFDEQKQTAFDLNATAAEYASLDADMKRVERLNDIIANRIKELNVSEDTGLVNVSVLEVGKPGGSPVRPDRVRVLGVGLALGLMLGVGVALGLDLLDQRIRSADEVTALLNLPVLGLVPHISSKESALLRGRKVALEPTSDTAEAYRTIRTAVYFGGRDRKFHRLLVTSPVPGDGKTTSASNLAIAMAQAGRNVLLLDADFRRPTQHKIFQLTDPLGFCDVVSGKATLEQAIHPTGIAQLDLMPCGAMPTNPSEILNSQIFLDLLDQLSARYEQIIIDSPPVTPVTDARIVAAICDATILVLRAERSTRRLSEQARESLASVGGNLIGVVINDVPRGRDRYGYYYGYGYGYRYYQYSSSQSRSAPAAAQNGNEGGGKDRIPAERALVTANGNGNGNGHGHDDDGSSKIGARPSGAADDKS